MAGRSPERIRGSGPGRTAGVVNARGSVPGRVPVDLCPHSRGSASVHVEKLRLLPDSVKELTGLRGIAVIFVILYHGGFPHMVGASLGVDIFFVLSGFLITSLLIREQAERGAIAVGQFYMRRVLRLMPALVFMLVGCIAFDGLASSGDAFRKTAGDAVVALFYMTNWSRALHWYEPALLGHAWSLSIEEQFYLIWPAIWIFVSRRFDKRTRLWATVALAAVCTVDRISLQAMGVDPLRIYNGTDTRADAILVGCVLAQLFALGMLDRLLSSRSLPALAGVAIAVLCVLSAVMDQLSPISNYVGLTVIEACAAALIVGSLAGVGSVARMLRSRVAQWFGARSYALYLWHFPLCIICLTRGLTQAQTALVAGLGAMLLSEISRRLVEKPFLRMKHRFESDRRGHRLSSGLHDPVEGVPPSHSVREGEPTLR
ncbi:peptidoglycan/LPS O-acetylase OafA/YrhL [Stenotrophomonas rhizophila]|nr:peptidoglycan/LPS O-acetylase OafA/YrhL [Stenotrophomonas rhizophila]